MQELAEARERAGRAEAEARLLRERVAELQADAQRKLVQFDRELEEADRDLAEARERAGRAEAQSAFLRGRVAELQAEADRKLVDYDRVLAEADRDLAEARERAGRAETEAGLLRRRVAELEAEAERRLAEFDRALSEADRDLAEADEDVAEARERAARAEAEAAQLRQRVADLQAELDRVAAPKPASPRRARPPREHRIPEPVARHRVRLDRTPPPAPAPAAGPPEAAVVQAPPEARPRAPEQARPPPPPEPEAEAGLEQALERAAGSERGRRWLGRAVASVLAASLLAFLAQGANRPADPRLEPAPEVPGLGEVAFRVSPPPRSGLSAGQFCALLARTSEQRSRGLAGRRNLAGRDAFVLRFDVDTRSTFFLRSVPVAMSVASFDSAGRFVSTTDMAPCPEGSTCPLYVAPRPFRVVVEVPQGGLLRLGIGEGSRIDVGGPCRRG